MLLRSIEVFIGRVTDRKCIQAMLYAPRTGRVLEELDISTQCTSIEIKFYHPNRSSFATLPPTRKLGF